VSGRHHSVRYHSCTCLGQVGSKGKRRSRLYTEQFRSPLVCDLVQYLRTYTPVLFCNEFRRVGKVWKEQVPNEIHKFLIVNQQLILIIHYDDSLAALHCYTADES
jgi:hypothetical protein